MESVPRTRHKRTVVMQTESIAISSPLDNRTMKLGSSSPSSSSPQFLFAWTYENKASLWKLHRYILLEGWLKSNQTFHKIQKLCGLVRCHSFSGIFKFLKKAGLYFFFLWPFQTLRWILPKSRGWCADFKANDINWLVCLSDSSIYFVTQLN